VLKNLDTKLLQSEKKSLVAFLSLYIFFSTLVLCFMIFLYYNFQKDLMLQQKREYLQHYSKGFILKLQKLHRNFSKTHIYPTNKKIRTAIYDSDRVKIFSLLHHKPDLDKIIYTVGNDIQYVKELDYYYLGAKYVVFEISDPSWFHRFYQKTILFGIPIFIIMIIFGYFLMRLFLRPMREALLLLDKFIKDTTHELNTPVFAILANIETIDMNLLDKKTIKKINRINIAAKTISNIYQDLTFLVLNHKIQSIDKNLNISEILKDRIEYFGIIAKSKKIDIISHIQDDVILLIDKNKITKFIDNIISNAIKYNQIQGTIKITLDNGLFIVEDSGIGIEKDKLNKIFDRYQRFNKSQGGFGIGLNIAWIIAQEYKMKITVKSKLNEYTKVVVKW